MMRVLVARVAGVIEPDASPVRADTPSAPIVRRGILRRLMTNMVAYGRAAFALRGPAAMVLLFWWIATAAIFLLERTASTRTLGVLVASALALLGVWWMRASIDDRTSRGARRAFLGASLLWTWVQVAFYSGWLVGPDAMRRAMPAQDASLSFAWTAVTAMSAYQGAMIGALAVAWLIAGRRSNRVAAAAMSLFWLEHQIASVNIFLGVRNPGRGFFPEHLAFLESYFGPARTTFALPLSIGAMLMVSVALAAKLRASRDSFRREACALLLVLAVLGVFELVVLGLPEGAGPFAWVTGPQGS